jgi:molybdenum cofactor biosynthesis enzyme MoaA
MALLKLKEILWELTNKCNKNCDYCGSKEVLNKNEEITLREIDLIINNITNYPPEELTLTGGEPYVSTHFKHVVKKINDYNTLKGLTQHPIIKLKIVTNGTLFKAEEKVIEAFDRIGLSINTEEEIKKWNEMNTSATTMEQSVHFAKFKNKITVITNFGTHNVWEFDKITKFLFDNKIDCWQVQLTTGKYQLQKDGIKYLYGKIKEIVETPLELSILKIKNSNATLVLSDCLQICHTCSAGINSCGITYDGKVIGCLSERSWKENMEVYGDLLGDEETISTLQQAWETSFQDRRFCTAKCCRDCIDYPNIDKENVKVTLTDGQVTFYPFPEDQYPQQPIAIYYGVFPNDKMTLMYGVGEPNSPSVTAYAVWGGGQTISTTYVGSGSSNDIVIKYGALDPKKKPPAIFRYGVFRPKNQDKKE